LLPFGSKFQKIDADYILGNPRHVAPFLEAWTISMEIPLTNDKYHRSYPVSLVDSQINKVLLYTCHGVPPLTMELHVYIVDDDSILEVPWSVMVSPCISMECKHKL
jgi:hypothetical protein